MKEKETAEENETKKSEGDENYKCNKCKDKVGEVICPCEVAPKYDPDYEEWRNK
jgi:tRNA(Ile2) C34 agmatinyltransferase TiaS